MLMPFSKENSIVYFAHSVRNRGGDKMILAHLGRLAESGIPVRIRTGSFDTIFPYHPEISVDLLEASSFCRTLLAALFQKYPQNFVVIATIIPLALLLSLRNKNRVVYFAQDYDKTYYSATLVKYIIHCAYFLGLTVLRIPTIAVSEKLADLLKMKYNAPVEVASNGIDLEVFYRDPSPELLLQCENRKPILVLSRHDERKGFDIALEVIRRVAEKVSVPFEVWTVGEPAQDDLSGHVHRDFGYVNEGRLRQILSSASLFLYPSRHEGFGLMVAEAFGCKCPVVTTEAIPFARHGNNALVSEIGDIDSLTENVSKILNNSTLVHVLTEEAYRQVSSLTLTSATATFEQLLSKVYTHDK
jgi:glycosyltransferase involved in cell wall biosynthesis